jgi:hypothetical protein
MADVEAGRIDCVVVYKFDRLSRSLLDFVRLVEVFDRHQVYPDRPHHIGHVGISLGNGYVLEARGKACRSTSRAR